MISRRKSQKKEGPLCREWKGFGKAHVNKLLLRVVAHRRNIVIVAVLKNMSLALYR